MARDLRAASESCRPASSPPPRPPALPFGSRTKSTWHQHLGGQWEKAHCCRSTCPPDRGLQSQSHQASILQQSSMHCNTRTSPQTLFYLQEASASCCGLTKALMFQLTDLLFIFLKRAQGNSSPEITQALQGEGSGICLSPPSPFLQGDTNKH